MKRLKADELLDIISKALSELGVPTPDYPAPVANAVAILQTAWPDAAEINEPDAAGTPASRGGEPTAVKAESPG